MFLNLVLLVAASQSLKPPMFLNLVLLVSSALKKLLCRDRHVQA